MDWSTIHNGNTAGMHLFSSNNSPEIDKKTRKQKITTDICYRKISFYRLGLFSTAT